MRKPTLREETEELLRREGLFARKKFSQNFLVDEEALAAILSAGELAKEDVVVEIGAGLGTLTAELAARAGKVFACEIDAKLAALLRRRFAKKKNLEIVEGDALHFNLPPRAKIVANLPYHLTGRFLRHFFLGKNPPRRVVLLLQKEVAERIADEKKLSLPALLARNFGEPRVIQKVPAASFLPAPRVDSAILLVEPKETLAILAEEFFDFAARVFQQKRKNLANALASLLGGKEAARALLVKAGIDGRRRAETLSLEEWRELWRAKES